MAERALWRGAISFGLIYVPVELHSAARDGSLGLHLLDKRDFAQVGYEHINKTTGKSVAWSDIVKGYEYDKGKFVALSDADFKHANAKASETIDISAFTEASAISPVYYDTPYFLAPGKGGAKVYALLRNALKATGKVAVATFVMRGRQHLCAVMPDDRTLTLVTLRFADELKVPAKLAAPAEIKLTAAELSMAKKLVGEMTSSWKPKQFKNTYREDLMRRIQEKIRRKETHSLAEDEPSAAEPPKAQVIDLMDALRKSLKAGGKRPASKPAAGKSRKRA